MNQLIWLLLGMGFTCMCLQIWSYYKPYKLLMFVCLFLSVFLTAGYLINTDYITAVIWAAVVVVNIMNLKKYHY